MMTRLSPAGVRHSLPLFRMALCCVFIGLMTLLLAAYTNEPTPDQADSMAPSPTSATLAPGPEKRANTKSMDEPTGQSPLHEIAISLSRNTEHIQPLVDGGADPNAKDSQGNRPLHYGSVPSSRSPGNDSGFVGRCG